MISEAHAAYTDIVNLQFVFTEALLHHLAYCKYTLTIELHAGATANMVAHNHGDNSWKLACMDNMAEHMLSYCRDVVDPILLLLLVYTTLPCRLRTMHPRQVLLGLVKQALV